MQDRNERDRQAWLATLQRYTINETVGGIVAGVLFALLLNLF